MDLQELVIETGESEPYDFQITVRGQLDRMRKCSPL